MIDAIPPPAWLIEHIDRLLREHPEPTQEQVRVQFAACRRQMRREKKSWRSAWQRRQRREEMKAHGQFAD